jgi:hypothetical protein
MRKLAITVLLLIPAPCAPSYPHQLTTNAGGSMNGTTEGPLRLGY